MQNNEDIKDVSTISKADVMKILEHKNCKVQLIFQTHKEYM